MKLDKKAKNAYKKLKNSIKVIGKIPEKKKRGATGEFELFKKIALERSITSNVSQVKYVTGKHITKDGEECYKAICLDDLTVTNFSHIVSKGRDKTKRLDPNNIEIVSRAYHEWQHTRKIAQTNYIN